MNSNEWPLILFTLFSQAGAGILVFGILLLNRSDGMQAATDPRRVLILTAMVLSGLALAIAFLHLGRPLQSVYALSNTGSSWLSREIILVAALFGLLLLASLLPFNTLWGTGTGKALTGLAAVTGLLLVYSMARLYMISTVPAWNTAWTPVGFFNSSLLLGSMASLLVIAWLLPRGGAPVEAAIRLLVWAALAGSAIHLLHALAGPGWQVEPGLPFPPAPIPVAWKLARILCLLAGIVLLMLWHRMPAAAVPGWLLPALALTGVAAAEVMARYIFYATYFRVGM